MSLDTSSNNRVHGRNEEIGYLQNIFNAFLKRTDDESWSKYPDCSSTDVTECSTSTDTAPSNRSDESYVCISSDTKDRSSLHGNLISNDCCFILISGSDGSGKRTLAHESVKVYRSRTKRLSISSLIHVSGLFRIYQEDEDEGNPYTSGRSREFEHSFSTFRDVFREMMDVLLPETELVFAILESLKRLLKDPKDAVALMEAFPCVKPLLKLEPIFQIDDPPEVYSRVFLQGMPSAGERLQVLCRAITWFLQAVSSCVPLVVVLEDLQNADEKALALIEMVLNRSGNGSETQSKGLVILATVTTGKNEVMSDAVTKILRRDMGDVTVNRRCIHQVGVLGLSWDDVREWTQNCGGAIQELSSDQKHAITNLVFHHTNGNPCHIQYLYQLLLHDKTLLSDPINKKSLPCTVVKLYTSILMQQDASVVNLVRCTAALAHHSEADIVDCDVLRVAMKKPCIDEVLQAHECGLLEFFPARGYVRYRQKDFQKASYYTIHEPLFLHLEIGRNLLTDMIFRYEQGKATDIEIKRMVLHAILHLRDSVELLSDFDERMQISKFFYEYGLRLSHLGDFTSSAKLFEFAISVLGPDSWRPDVYETCLVLHNAVAQTYFYICDVEKTDRTLNAIFSNARSFEDKIPAYIVLVYARSKGQMIDGFRTITLVLSELGNPIHENPSTFTIIKNLVRVKWSLLGKSDDVLDTLPDATGTNLIVAHFLSFAMFFIYVVQPKTSLLLCSRLLSLSLKEGISGPSAVAYAQYGYILSGMGNIEEGYRFCQLSLSFADRFEVWRPRMYLYIHGLTSFWTHPFRDSIDPLYQAQCDAIKYGDMQSYGALAGFTVSLLLKLGAPLKALLVDAQSFCEDVAKVGQVSPLFLLIPTWSVINDLTGSHETLNMHGEIRDFDTLLKFAAKEGAKLLLGRFYADRLMVHYLVGEYQQSLEMARKSREYRKLMDFSVTFYEGLATSALSWTLKWHKRRKRVCHCRKLAKQMRIWADRCPENFRNKQLLLEAEIAVMTGLSSLAFSLFAESIAIAKRENFLHEEGIAYERLGLHQLHVGNIKDAKVNFENARTAFAKWGATIVVDRLDKLLLSMKVE